MKLGTRRITIILVVVLASYALYAGCNNFYTHSANKKLHIAVILKSVDPGFDFWTIVQDGITAAAKEFDVEVSTHGPKLERDISGQIAILEEVILSKPDAIVLAAADYNALVPSAEKIKQAGIALVTLDSGINSTIPRSFIATDNIAGGKKMGEILSSIVNPNKRIAIVSHVKVSLTAIEREQGLRQGLSKSFQETADGPYFSDTDSDKAYTITKNLLTTQSDIGGIAGLNEKSTVGAAKAIQELGLSNEVMLVGFDSSMSEIKLIEEGVIKAVVIQKPFNMGYLSVKTAVEFLKGQKVSPSIDTGSQSITKENMYSTENQKLLFPFVNK
jgi:ribose transport system substrate-binding protein